MIYMALMGGKKTGQKTETHQGEEDQRKGLIASVCEEKEWFNLQFQPGHWITISGRR
jgi:hypothetical protein